MCLGWGASKGAGDGSQKKPCKWTPEDEADGQVRQRGSLRWAVGVFGGITSTQESARYGKAEKCREIRLKGIIIARNLQPTSAGISTSFPLSPKSVCVVLRPEPGDSAKTSFSADMGQMRKVERTW